MTWEAIIAIWFFAGLFGFIVYARLQKRNERADEIAEEYVKQCKCLECQRKYQDNEQQSIYEEEK